MSAVAAQGGRRRSDGYSQGQKEDANMLNLRLKHDKLPDYALRFIGYSAYIMARKRNAQYASLDFISGTAALFADGGFLIAPNRPALSSAVADLPSCIDELKLLVNSVSPDSNGHWAELRRGEVGISVTRGANVERIVSQLARRYRAIEPILEQAERVGSEIKRLPYDDYIDEIAKTGFARVVSYGDAFFVDGKLAYCPERRTVLMDVRTF
jgi:hypothetical protein